MACTHEIYRQHNSGQVLIVSPMEAWCNGRAVNIRLRTAYVIITIYIPRWDYAQFRSLTLELPTSSNPNVILFVLVCLFGLVLDARAPFHFFLNNNRI